MRNLKQRYNSDLASGLGNLVARVITLAKNINFQNQFLINSNSNFQTIIDKTQKKYRKSLEEFKFNEALIAIWDLISFCDKYIEKERPWEEKEKQKEVIGNLLFAVSEIAKIVRAIFTRNLRKNI